MMHGNSSHEGLEPVRKRPGMYIGSTGYDSVHHLIKKLPITLLMTIAGLLQLDDRW